MSSVLLSGIRVRNLQDVSVSFTPGEIVLLTGVSGSGKSSLAFDTIYAIGRKRYLSTLPAFFATKFFPMPTPQVEHVEGLSPTIAVKQHFFAKNIHATVGSTTEILQHLGLLFALDGEARDPDTQEPLHIQSKDSILSFIMELPEEEPISFFAPLLDKAPTSVQESIRNGFTKVYIDGTPHPLYTFVQDGLPEEKETYILVDAVIKRPSNHPRLKVSLLATLELGKGHCFLETSQGKYSFSTQVYVEEKQKTYVPLTSQLFSPHSTQNRCSQCRGSGLLLTITDSSLINPNASIQENCCPCMGNASTFLYRTIYQSLAQALGFQLDTPWKELPKDIQETFLYGKDQLILPVKLIDAALGKRTLSYKIWKGVLNELGEKIRYSSSPEDLIPAGISCSPCPRCHYTGLGEYALAAIWHGKSFADFYHMSLKDLNRFLQTLSTQSPAVEEVIQGIISRVSTLNDLGLSYLTLDRSLATLSGGEQERTALAKHLGAELSGITYILDEPSIGLHPQDTHKLIRVIQKLRDRGNTILVVEHDEHMISFVDRIIDIGPGAGALGGQILFNGEPRHFLKECSSLTAQYLRHEKEIPIPEKTPWSQGFLTLRHANKHNLKDISISLPLGKITSITGVSGSGKSTLINEVLLPAVQRSLEGREEPLLQIDGNLIQRCVHISRDLPGRSQRSIPLTYLKIFDAIRHLFAQQPYSIRRGLTKGHFSFNTPLGACPECQGLGFVTPNDVTEKVLCSQCHGARFQEQILEVKFQGKSLAEILDMTAGEAEVFFQTVPHIHEQIFTLCSLGLSYLPLGRPLSSLSGGEMQRLKLASEFLLPRQEATLYILDEPTTGLHTHDVHTLIEALLSLSRQGHTVIIIEHNMHVVKISDYVIELGPEGGAEGGYILAQCPPEELIQLTTPTAYSLKPYFSAPQLPEIKKDGPKVPINQAITLTDVHHNNLKHIDLTIPTHCLTAVVGPSASGKHTLVFDVLHASGNLAYAELFPTYIRQALIRQTFLPHVEKVQGLSPVIAIKKESSLGSSKYSLASLLGISSELEKIFSLSGTPHSPITGKPLTKVTIPSIIEELLATYKGTYITITVPIPKEKDLTTFLLAKQMEGYVKLAANNTFYDIEEGLPKNLSSPALVIQHVKVEEKQEASLSSALALAFSQGKTCRILCSDGHAPKTYTLGWQDSLGNTYPPLNKKMFSPYQPEGACPTCHGSGHITRISLAHHQEQLGTYTPLELVSWLFPHYPVDSTLALLQSCSIAPETPIQTLSPETFQLLCQGTADTRGLDILLTEAYEQAPSALASPLFTSIPCPSCEGSGLNAYTRHVHVCGQTLHSLYKQDAQFLKQFLSTLPEGIQVQDLLQRLDIVEKVGLDYINLGQKQDSLSSGEAYRLRLAKILSASLTHILYLLEDPLAGLHPTDKPKIITLLKEVVAQKNTVIATDRHGLANHADHVIPLGPGSGPLGGTLLDTIPEEKERLVTDHPLQPSTRTWSVHVSSNNLQDLTLPLPLGNLVGISGPSGSGKTTLLMEGCYPAAEKWIEIGKAPFSEVLVLDSYPIPASTRSDIGTYFDITPTLRSFYSSLTQAKSLHITPAMFSTNTKQGQCSDCLGLGYHLIDRAFYAIEQRPCPTCSGYRIQPLSQEVVYEGKHFGQILQMPVEEILALFPFLKKIRAPLQALVQAGLGYLPIGRSFSSLSLGERIAIKIARFLYLPPKHPTLFLLDELSSSLDRDKKHRLYKQYRKLIQEGHSLIIVEHDPELLACVDHIVELGPKAGKYGGKVVYQGPPMSE